jgi:SWIM zinc finger
VTIQSIPRLQLASIFAKEFSTSSRNRGDEYFRLHRVKIRTGSSAELSALVQGTEPYEVLLKLSENKLAISCGCPYFLDQGQTCKHLWAAILAADEQGHLGDATAANGTTLNRDESIDQASSGLFPTPIRIIRAGQAAPAIKPPPPPRPPPPPAWKAQLSRIAKVAASYRTEVSPWPAEKEIVYLLDVVASQAAGNVALTIATRERKKDGRGTTIPRPYPIHRSRIAALPHAEDRELLTILMGGDRYSSYGYLDSYDRSPTTFSLPSVTAQTILPKAVRTGRLLLYEKDENDKAPLRWDDGEPWRFVLEIRGSEMEGWQLRGGFRRGEERMGINEPLLAIPGGFLFTRERVAPLAEDETFPWIADLRNNKPMVISEEQREEFLSSLLCSPALPMLDLPEQLQYEEVTLSPRKCLKISQPGFSYKKDGMRAELSFEYEGHPVPEHALAGGIY